MMMMMTGFEFFDAIWRTTTIEERKRVHFSEYCEMFRVPRTSELSDEEFEATYMTENDYCRIETDIEDSLRQMDLNIAFAPPRRPSSSSEARWCDDRALLDCFRGLESRTPLAMRMRRERIDFAVGAVLSEQRARGWLTPEWVAENLRAWTIPFEQAAHAMGVWDSHRAANDFERRYC